MCFNRFSPMQHPRFWGFQVRYTFHAYFPYHSSSIFRSYFAHCHQLSSFSSLPTKKLRLRKWKGKRYNNLEVLTLILYKNSLEKEFKTKVDGETDEEKQKNYYSSKEYQRLEKKKTKIGIVKKKQVSIPRTLFFTFNELI